MERWKREELYYSLKDFLTREFDNKKRERELLSEEKEKLETEKNKKSKKLFQIDESGERRKLFSPLDTIFYPSQGENFQDRKLKNLNYRIEKLNQQIGGIDSESDQMEGFLGALGEFLELEKEPESVEKTEGTSQMDFEITENLADSLEELQRQVNTEYDKIELLFDIDDSGREDSVERNQYNIELLYHLIHTSIHRVHANTFLIDIKNKKEFQMEVEILADGEKVDHCTFTMGKM